MGANLESYVESEINHIARLLGIATDAVIEFPPRDDGHDEDQERLASLLILLRDRAVKLQETYENRFVRPESPA